MNSFFKSKDTINLDNNNIDNRNMVKKKVRTMSSSNGLSLVEVIVALALLVIIMFFMSSTQLSAINMNQKTAIIRELTQTAEREIESRRQLPQLSSLIVNDEPACFYEVEEYSCETTIHPCSIENDNVVCVDTEEATFPASEAAAHQIVIDIKQIAIDQRVPVEQQTQRSIRLQTIVEAKKSE